MKHGIEEFADICQRNYRGAQVGVCSVCSSNPFVIEASLLQYIEDRAPLIIESTSNQVDQFGGYSGMKPADFVAYIYQKAANSGIDYREIVLGGDHLGPNRWRNKDADEAMRLSETLIAEYVKAGFRKIHIDASMPLGGDGSSFCEQLVAERTARLCKVAEESFSSCFPGDAPPVYIIGSEVPTPGGITNGETALHPTSPAQLQITLDTMFNTIEDWGLTHAAKRIIGFVIQPGIEFGNDSVINVLDTAIMDDLDNVIESSGKQIIFEAHSTDYQSRNVLEKLVRHHFAILKVGPWLTYAMREALYALSMLEDELFSQQPKVRTSKLKTVIEQKMIENPQNWIHHCSGSDTDKYIQRHYGYSDRIRYYLTHQDIKASINTLFANLEKFGTVPRGIMHQFLPTISKDRPKEIVHEAIQQVLRIYHRATGY